jgi:PAS domain S-box-containing protein
MKILVADDDSVYGATVAHLLERAGHRAIVVDNGEEAWRLMKGREAPMVAILDWKMPGMTGVEICRKIRARDEFQPYIIMLTAHSEKDLMVAGFMAGADDYMVKPVDTDELCARVRVGVRMVDMQAQYVDRAKQAEARYQSIFRNAVLGIYQTSPRGRFIRVNPAMARILGYRYPEELLAAIGDVARDVYVDPKQRREFVRKMGVRGVVDGFESLVKQRDGSEIWVSEQARAVTDPNGEILYYEGTMQDISAQKKTELALKESEQRLRVLVENAPEAIVVFDVDLGQFVDANKNAQRLFGLDREALMKTGPIELSPELQPDGRPSATAAGIFVQQALDGAFPSFNWVHCDSKGREFVSEIRLARLPATERKLLRASMVDISERLSAEQQLREHDQLLVGIFDSLTPELAVLDKAGTIVHASRSWLAAAPDCGVGTNYLEVAFECQRETANSVAGIQAVLDGKRSHFESELTRLIDEEIHSFHMHVDPMPADRGGVVVTHNDVTEQRRSDAAMREEATRNAQLLSLESVLAHSSGADNICRVVAAQAAKLLAGSRCAIWRWDSVSGHWDATALSANPDDKALLCNTGQLTEPVFTETSDGEPVLVMPVLNGLELLGAILCVGDIVGHARREETLRGLANRLAQALLAERSRNEGLKQLLRLKLINEITHAIGCQFDLQNLFESILQHLERRQGVAFSGAFLFDQEAGGAMLHALGPGGETRVAPVGIRPGVTIAMSDPLAVAVTDFRSECIHDTAAESANFASRLAEAGIKSVAVEPITIERELLGMLMVGRENASAFSVDEIDFLHQISEHVALAVFLRQQYASMQNAYRDLQQKKEVVARQQRLNALGEMAAGMVHDINNALSPILGYSQLLLETEKGLSETARQQLTTMRLAANTIAEMANRVREFYRQRAQSTPLAAVDIPALIENAVELTRPRWYDMPLTQGKVIEVNTDVMDGLPEIQGIKAELRDVLTNLIINAADAMPDGGSISLRAYTCGVDVSTPLVGVRASRIVISVSDTGIGMDPVACQRCIDPFYSTKGPKGTGLGLAQVYGTVKRHDGDLKIESELGAGTTFRLIFPLRGAAALSTPTPEPSDAQTPPLEILFVDDEPALGSLIDAMLKPIGHRVTTACNGEDALAALSAADEAGDPFDLVITDLGMPRMDGSELARHIKARWPGLPVILLTGWGRYSGEGIAEEIDYVISKPTDRHTLQRCIARVVNS